MKTFFQIFAIALFILTVVVVSIKPNMHKNIMIYDSAYKIISNPDAEIQKQEIPKAEITVRPAVTTIKKEPVENKTIKNNSQTIPIKTSTTQTKISEKNVQPKVEQKTVPTTTQVQKNIKKTENTENIKTQLPDKSVINEIKTTPAILTEQEEAVAWNIWRSNLQNKIMQDVKLPVLPQGIIFRFTFTVDKYGKISNIQTWSDNSAYTPYAIQYIAPVIRNCQGKTILNFPQGTLRTTTDVKGGWKISEIEKYSTPNDYNDIEKIRSK